MKQKLLFLFTMLLLPLMASAFIGEAIIDGIKYNIITKSQTAEVLANNYSGDIVIPSVIEYEGVNCNVTSIGNSAFNGCSGLTSVTIPNSIFSIGTNAFEDCCNLTSVIIPEGVTSIGDGTFQDCSSLACITIPDGLTSIGDNAFIGCSSLLSINIPSSVNYIGKYAFYNCTSLSSVHITDLEAWLNITIRSGSGNPLCFGNHLFLNGEEVKDLVIPNSITVLKFAAFYRCGGLNSVFIPNSVTTINKSAFCGCFNLTSVIISDGVTSIGTYAFEACSRLPSIIIPNNVSSIGAHAFQNCDSLTSVTIGSGVTSIGGVAFASCKELTDVYCWAKNVPGTGGDAFQDSYIEYATLHVPASSINAYKSTAPWSSFKKIVALTDEDIPKAPKCDKPNIIKEGNKFWFECATPGATFKSKVTPNVEEQEFVGNEVEFQSGTITYTLTVVASADGYEDSEPVNMILTIERSDVNQDGKVDVADIATIIDKMAGK